jgi:hypothetical protein
MGLKQRNGNLYFYENRREGERVVSNYIGGGPLALERAEEEAVKRQAFEQQRAEIAGLSASVDTAVDRLMQMAEVQLVASGFHRHKRQWRKRRNGQSGKDRG